MHHQQYDDGELWSNNGYYEALVNDQKVTSQSQGDFKTSQSYDGITATLSGDETKWGTSGE